ncbi:MAG: hypothetical protein EXR98_12275 [Gemmataceae bacterium]|nr:hypothetical protein [Gemmataceae bacterium]
MMARSLLVLVFVVSVAPAGEQKRVDLSARAKEIVEKQVQDWKGEGIRIQVIEEKYLAEVFPKHKFVAVHFPLWPVARVAPEPMKSQNLFAVSNDRKVTHLADSTKLEEFFKKTLKAEVNPDKITRGWLRLRMEYIQDGFYKFKYPETAKEGPTASSVTILYGVVEVVPEGGNKGTFTATLRFKQDGQLASLSEDNKVLRGMRPRVLGD